MARRNRSSARKKKSDQPVLPWSALIGADRVAGKDSPAALAPPRVREAYTHQRARNPEKIEGRPGFWLWIVIGAALILLAALLGRSRGISQSADPSSLWIIVLVFALAFLAAFAAVDFRKARLAEQRKEAKAIQEIMEQPLETFMEKAEREEIEALAKKYDEEYSPSPEELAKIYERAEAANQEKVRVKPVLATLPREGSFGTQLKAESRPARTEATGLGSSATAAVAESSAADAVAESSVADAVAEESKQELDTL